MPFLLAEILNFQSSTHRIGVGSFSSLYIRLDIRLMILEEYRRIKKLDILIVFFQETKKTSDVG